MGRTHAHGPLMHADIHSGHACSTASSTRNPTFRAAETINHGLDYMQETHEHDVSPIVLHLEQMQKRLRGKIARTWSSLT
ncbi:hypothetical protein CGMCC3_g6790 [Colletotrichum fructicola]|nr:uncharacterized protein CGMCC3_g6790 [Colletotrichum fructicola]KAE9577196.1 hypothetical protein CGMCC3_g6790 [Colletotrichum fructicola]KAF5491404.1 hypothetical protein CGCF413_v011342 [Colletotrichum fructicola]